MVRIPAACMDGCHGGGSATRAIRSKIKVERNGAEAYQLTATQSTHGPVMSLKLRDIGGLRLGLLLLTLLTLPLVRFAGMEPEGIGVMTAYIVPALVVLFFFVLMLDALMNRVFMIEQPLQEQRVRRLRMWLGLAAGAAILAVWGPYFRTLLRM